MPDAHTASDARRIDAESGGLAMVSTYHGVETGRSAIMYFRKGMEIAGINTQNALQEGYSRQAVNAATAPALSTQTNMSHLGTGVRVESIERLRDQFLDARMRRSSVEEVYWETLAEGLLRVDKFIVNASEKGINNYLDSFWTAIQEVHKHPDDQAIRSAFINEASNLVVFANSLTNSYNAYRDELNKDVRALAEEANSIIDQIGILNAGIRSVQLAGAEPNMLLDQRDVLADRLCVLTGAEVGTDADELDGDYKISLNGVLLVQGQKLRHLVLVENPANTNYYEVQIEHNQYDITTDPAVAQVIVERRADDLTASSGSCTMDALHQLEVLRLADELYWTVGNGKGQSDGGSRMDGIENPRDPLNIQGSFALQVGSNGVRAVSESFTKNPPGTGVVLGALAPNESSQHSFRIAAGDFETTVTLKWNDIAGAWDISDNYGHTAQSATGDLTVEELGQFIDLYADGIDVSYADNVLVFESTERQMMSITDVNGSLMRTSGLANANPVVKIDVTAEDSLWTIANKINNAYMFDRTKEVDEDGKEIGDPKLKYETVPPNTAPSSPEEWLHASVEPDGQGGYFLCLTSNVAGESHRINVMSGGVCGGDVQDMTVARLLGLVDDNPGQEDVTSYIQFDKETGAVIDRFDPYGDVFVDDAWVRYDGKEYLSASNAFKDARKIAEVGNARADQLTEFSPGIRVFLQDTGETTINVRHPLTSGEIFAKIKLRDDVLLSQMDVFDEMIYELVQQFNAVHYAGYGSGEYAETTGMAFFEGIANAYGAFGDLSLDSLLEYDQNRIAAKTGDGKGKSLGTADGTNALSIARLKQAKIFLDGTGDFSDLYKDFVAQLGSFAQRVTNSLSAQRHVSEQIEVQRKAVMGVNADEEMLNIVQFNQSFNYASQYLSTLMQVIDQIISGVGRVGI